MEEERLTSNFETSEFLVIERGHVMGTHDHEIDMNFRDLGFCGRGCKRGVDGDVDG